MAGYIELHYSSDFAHLQNNFLKTHLHLLSNSDSLLYLVHSNNRVQSLKDNFLYSNSQNFTLAYPFTTYAKFYQRLFSFLNIPKKQLTFLQGCFLLHEIFKSSLNNLSYFSLYERSYSPIILTELVDYFNEIRLNDADKLLLNIKETRLALSTADKLQNDFHFLFKNYLEARNPDNFDESDLLKEVISQFNRRMLKSYNPNLKYIVLEDISFFKNLHIQLIKHLKSIGLRIFLLLHYGKNPEIFLHKKLLFNKLKGVSDHVKGYRQITKLSNTLFQIRGKEFNFFDKVKIFSTSHRLQEVGALAADIKKRVVDNNWNYSKICVTSPQLTTYRPLIETIFSRYKIPYAFRENKLLGASSLLCFLRIILRIVNENYPVTLIQKILRSHLFIYRDMLLYKNSIDILSNLRVKSGKREILSALEREKKFYESKTDTDGNANINVTEYHQLIHVLRTLFEDISFLEKSGTGKRVYTHFVRLINKHKMSKRIYQQGGEDNQLLSLEIYRALRQFLISLGEWIESSSIFNAKTKYSVDDLSDIFEIIAKNSSFNISSPRNFGVQIIPISQLLDQRFSAVYVLGMEDGIFPRGKPTKFPQPHNLTGELRSFIPDDYVTREREIFLKMLQQPADFIRFSYPRFHKDKPVLPSIFIRELNRISSSSLVENANICLFTPSDMLQKLQNYFDPDEPDDIDKHHRIEKLETMISPELIKSFNHRVVIGRVREKSLESSVWEGFLSGDRLSTNWFNTYFKKQHFSPTQLEIYAKCPMMYFFQRILKVKPYEEAEEYLTALDRGILLHRIMFRYFRKGLYHDLNTLLSIAKEELGKIPIPHDLLWEIEKEHYLGSSETKGLLPEFLEYEDLISNEYNTLPKYFEWSFGTPFIDTIKIDESSTVKPLVWEKSGEKIFLKGKIDRIEISSDGIVLVVDYKTGEAPGFREIWQGEKLQLPIYLHAACELLKDNHSNLSMGGGAFYILKIGKKIIKKIVFIDHNHPVKHGEIDKRVVLPNDKYHINGNPQTLIQLTERTLNFAMEYISGIREGKFSHTLDERKCRRWDGKLCEMFPMCKVNRKKQALLWENFDKYI